MKLSKLIWHKSASGKSVPGIIPVTGIAVFCFYLTYMMVGSSPEVPDEERDTSVVDIADIAETTTTVRTASAESNAIQDESISTRQAGVAYSNNLGFRDMNQPEEVVARNSINTIMEQLMSDAPAPTGRRVIDDAPMVPSYVEKRELLPTKGTVFEGGESQADVAIVGFSRPTPEVDPSETRQPSGFETNHFLPRGHRIPVVLLGNFETGDLDTTAEFAVTKDVYFQNNLILERGTKILAAGSQASVRELISFQADTILYPDGRELPVSASVKSLNGQTGLMGEYVEPPIGANIVGYSGAIIEALGTIATETEDKVEVVSSDSATVTQDRTEAKPYSAQNAMIKAAQDIATDRLKKKEELYLEQNQAYVKIESGARGYFLLTSSVDFNNSAIGGSYQKPVSPDQTEEIIKQAVSDYYSYGTIGGNGGIALPAPALSTNTPLNIPGLK